MNLDKILLNLGEFGLYQKFNYFLICLASLYIGIHVVMSIIFMGNPDHRCKIPGLDNDTYAVQGPGHQLLINNNIPPPSDDEEYDQCHLYLFTYNTSKFDNSSRPINGSLVKCKEWVYSDAVFKETLSSKLNIVCDKIHMTSLVKSLFFVGMLIGSILFGQLSDIIGRKTTVCTSLMLLFVLTFAKSWSSISFPLYAAMVLIIGASSQGAMGAGFVLGVELVGPSKRRFAGVIIHIFFSIGLVILACVSYFVRHWYYINIVCSAPSVLFILYWWLLPESPRWLISKHRYDEAKAVLQKAAKVNKVTLDSELFEKQTEDETSEPNGRVWHLFSSRVMLLRTLVILFNWFTVSMVYYGLSLNAGNLGGSIYVNLFIAGLVEVPANVMLILLIDRIGRKKLHLLSLVIGGVSCASTIVPILYSEKKHKTIIIVLAMIGKFGITAAFNTIYFFSAELFPTVVRNAGMGTSSFAARIGGILAPYIADSAALTGGKIGKALPMAIFGLFSIVAGLLSLFLPETVNRPLPETIEDGKLFGKCKNRPKGHRKRERRKPPYDRIGYLPERRNTSLIPPGSCRGFITCLSNST